MLPYILAIMIFILKITPYFIPGMGGHTGVGLIEWIIILITLVYIGSQGNTIETLQEQIKELQEKFSEVKEEVVETKPVQAKPVQNLSGDPSQTIHHAVSGLAKQHVRRHNPFHFKSV